MRSPILATFCAAAGGFVLRGALEAAKEGDAPAALILGLLAALDIAAAFYWSRKPVSA